TVIRRETFTDTDGFYKFTDLPAGDYEITEIQPGGNLYDALDTVGSLGGQAFNDRLELTLPAGGNGVEYNFGEVTPGEVSGYAYIDLNGDGRLTPGEPGIPGVTITVSGTAFPGTPLERPLTAELVPGGLTTTTNAEGVYEFPVLPPGVYTIAETQPAGFIDGLEENGDFAPDTVLVGNDVFGDVDILHDQLRGPLNFGELLPAGEVSAEEISKRLLLASTGFAFGPTVEATGQSGPGFPVVRNPQFAVQTGVPRVPTLVAIGADAGWQPLVRVLDYATGLERFRFKAYSDSFTGGVRVATGDVNGDGVEDVVTAAGPGGAAHVRAFDGVTGRELLNFFAFDTNFRGGAFVAVGDVDGDGVGEIVVGADAGGGPRVTVLDGRTGAVVQDFFAFEPGFGGGVRVAVGDTDGDGVAEVVAAAGAGGGPRVRLLDARTLAVRGDFFAYDPGVRSGLYAAAADVNGDGRDDVVLGPGAGNGPHVRALDGLTQAELLNFFAYDPGLTAGVRVAAADVNGDGRADVVTGPGGSVTTQVKVFDAAGLAPLDEFWAIESTFINGVFVG
ncbi:MAG TPA: SdrD B-like domain-containing protein, partial [Gemmataceae bacterium]